MKENIKEEWIDALKSGEYVQGKGKLRDGDTYCCLGVLCDMYAKRTGRGAWLKQMGSDYAFVTDGVRLSVHSGYMFGGDAGLPPHEVRAWAGLLDGKDISTLSEKNDASEFGTVAPHTFAMIADVIEAEF